VFQGYGPIPGRTEYPRSFEKEWRGIKFVLDFDGSKGSIIGGITTLTRHFNQYTVNADLRIYFTTYMAYPEVIHPCISICHGIWWDHPEMAYKSMTKPQREEFWRLNLETFQKVDRVVSVDHNVRNVIQAIEPGLESRITVIPNYVDTNKFYPVEKTWEGIRVLYPRRTTLIRGWNHFMRAARRLPEYEFYTCGDSHDSDQQAKLEENAHYEIPNLRVEHRDMDDMPSFYQMGDICTIPTLGVEGLSLSLLEAMACGLPIITTRTGGLGEAVIDRYNALIYNPIQEHLEAYIKELAENPTLMKKMGERNRQIAVESFDISIWHERWKKVIEEVVS